MAAAEWEALLQQSRTQIKQPEKVFSSLVNGFNTKNQTKVKLLANLLSCEGVRMQMNGTNLAEKLLETPTENTLIVLHNWNIDNETATKRLLEPDLVNKVSAAIAALPAVGHQLFEVMLDNFDPSHLSMFSGLVGQLIDLGDISVILVDERIETMQVVRDKMQVILSYAENDETKVRIIGNITSHKDFAYEMLPKIKADTLETAVALANTLCEKEALQRVQPETTMVDETIDLALKPHGELQYIPLCLLRNLTVLPQLAKHAAQRGLECVMHGMCINSQTRVTAMQVLANVMEAEFSEQNLRVVLYRHQRESPNTVEAEVKVMIEFLHAASLSMDDSITPNTAHMAQTQLCALLTHDNLDIKYRVWASKALVLFSQVVPLTHAPEISDPDERVMANLEKIRYTR